MTILSLLIANPESRAVRRDLADAEQLHRTVMSAFPALGRNDARRALGVLHRVDASRDGDLALLVQSEAIPNWSHLPSDYLRAPAQNKRIDSALERMAEGQRLGYRLRANPTRSLPAAPRGENGKRARGRRIPITTEAEQIQWLARNGLRYGFELPAAADGGPLVASVREPKITGRRAGSVVELTCCTFDGVLRVTDPVKLRVAIREGVGRGRAYGCGLLSVRPSA